MRNWLCVPMLTLLLLSGCGSQTEENMTAEIRGFYQNMEGCAMEAAVSCQQEDFLWEAVLRCEEDAEGVSVITVLEPETIAGIQAILQGTSQQLAFEGDVLNAGTCGTEQVSPAECLPRLVDAIQNGWLLEENQENWEETPCLRLALDQTGPNGGKIVSTVWLRQADGTPVRGEIAVDGEIILTAEFTSFRFYDTMTNQSAESG